MVRRVSTATAVSECWDPHEVRPLGSSNKKWRWNKFEPIWVLPGRIGWNFQPFISFAGGVKLDMLLHNLTCLTLRDELENGIDMNRPKGIGTTEVPNPSLWIIYSPQQRGCTALHGAEVRRQSLTESETSKQSNNPQDTEAVHVFISWFKRIYLLSCNI